jgi:hypothetical protein
MESNGKVLLFFKCTNSDKTKNIFFPPLELFCSLFLNHVSIATVWCLCASCCIRSIKELRQLKYKNEKKGEKVFYFHFTISGKRSRVFYCEIKVEINIFLRFLCVSCCEKCSTTATTSLLLFKINVIYAINSSKSYIHQVADENSWDGRDSAKLCGFEYCGLSVQMLFF